MPQRARGRGGVYSCLCAAFLGLVSVSVVLVVKVLPYLPGLDTWKWLTISSDNGPHYAQTYVFFALMQLAFPSSVLEVRWAFDCPYHGAILSCDVLFLFVLLNSRLGAPQFVVGGFDPSQSHVVRWVCGVWRFSLSLRKGPV